jgi:predicted MFS family arabinose efflux permease
LFRNLTPALSIGRFRRVWLGQGTNVIGDAVYAVAIALFLLPRRDAPEALGLVLSMASIGGIVSLLAGGMLADRHRRGPMIIVSDVIRSAGVLGIVLAGHNAPLIVLGGLAAVLGVGTGLYRPAYGAILPTLVPKDLIAGANSLRSLANRLGMIVGASVGGIIASATSPSWALLADIVTFAVSIATLIGLKEEPPQRDSSAEKSVVRDVIDGFAYVGRHLWMAGVMLQGTAQMALVAAPVAVLLPLLTGPKGWFGYITAAAAVGACGGATVASSIQTRSPGWVAMLALLAQLPQTILLALDAPTVLILLASVLTGAGLAVFAVLWTTALQTSVPGGQLGRVFSLDQLAAVGLTPVGYVFAGWLYARLGASALGWGAASCLLLSVVVVLPLPGLRELTDRPRQDMTVPVEA